MKDAFKTSCPHGSTAGHVTRMLYLWVMLRACYTCSKCKCHASCDVHAILQCYNTMSKGLAEAHCTPVEYKEPMLSCRQDAACVDPTTRCQCASCDAHMLVQSLLCLCDFRAVSSRSHRDMVPHDVNALLRSNVVECKIMHS